VGFVAPQFAHSLWHRTLSGELRVERKLKSKLVIRLDRKLQRRGEGARAGIPIGNWGVAAPDLQR